MTARLGIGSARRNARAHPVPSRKQSGLAQRQVEPPHLVEPHGALASRAHERMAEQRHQRDRIEGGSQLGKQQQQRARRGARQRLAGAVIDADAPARQRGGDALGERAVGGDEGSGAPRRLDRLAHQQGDSLRLLPVVGKNSARQAGNRRRQIARRLPLGAVVRGREEQRGEGRPRLWPIIWRGGVPWQHLIASNAHAIEQQLQMILRMRFERAPVVIRIGPRRAERIPFIRRHHLIEPGQHDHAARHIGHGAEQPRDGRSSGGNARRDDEARWRRRAPPRGDAIEQQVAARRAVDRAGPGKRGRPFIDQQPQPRQRRPPMVGKGAEIEIDERRNRHLFIMKLVDHAAQPIGKLERRRACDCRFARRRVPLDQLGEQQAPVQRIDGRRQRIVVDRIKRQRDRFIEIGVADHRQPRHEKPLPACADERRLHRAACTIARQQDQPLRQPQRAVVEARDHPGGERVGDGPMNRDGIGGGLCHKLRHCEQSEAIQSRLRKLWIASRSSS